MNQLLEHLLTIPSFVLWIKGECSPRATEYWDAWASEQPAHEQRAREAREIVEAVQTEYEIPDPQAELQKLTQEMSRRKKQQPGQLPFYLSRSTWWGQAGAVAAGIMLAVALLGGIFAYRYGPAEKASAEGVALKTPFNKKYTTGYGEKVAFRHSDGSSIMLNANSNLRFSSTIKKALNTEVWLEGEAYVDIAHLEGDNQRTFTVHTNDGAIQVLSTRVAVNTFGPGTQTALEQGKINIRIQKEDENGGPTTEYALQAGEVNYG